MKRSTKVVNEGKQAINVDKYDKEQRYRLWKFDEILPCYQYNPYISAYAFLAIK